MFVCTNIPDGLRRMESGGMVVVGGFQPITGDADNQKC